MVHAYSMTGSIIALYVANRVSFCFSQEAEVRALRILIDESVFSLVILMCSPKLKLVSNVSPRIFGFFTVGLVTLLIARLSVMLCSCLSGVIRVV